MSNSRFPILLTICLSCSGLLLEATGVGMLKLPKLQALAQTEGLRNPLPPPLETSPVVQPSSTDSATPSKYDTYMKEGSGCVNKKDFASAVKSFRAALQERPGDGAAERALKDAEAQALQQNTAPSNNAGQAPDDQPQAASPFLLYLGIALLSLVVLGALAPLAAKLYADRLKVAKRPKSKFKKDTSSQGFSSYDGGFDTDTYNNGSSFANEEQEEQWNPSLPVQRTTRLPNIDLVLQLIDDLKDPEPRVRRRAIWKLAQISDSRSMQSLLDTMIDTDSYDRSLILEALSQICIRTLRPMNQALAISLQDKNPQVRKNALRDLTRMYNVMAQISQLVAHATEDPDTEVQQTARWAMKQLNLPAPIKLDIPESVVEESEEAEEASYTESAELET